MNLTKAAACLASSWLTAALGPQQDVASLYWGFFNVSPITNLTRDDPQSALAMMEFARVDVYAGCSLIPFVEGLVSSPPFLGGNFGSDSLTSGTAQAKIGKILAYSAA